MDTILFHVSEAAGITRFVPRPTNPQSGGPEGEFVWALDDAHLHTYLLPRDCPRVVFFPTADSRPEDVARFMGATTAPRVLAIESAWLARAMAHRLYVYALPSHTFALADAAAGHYVSRQPVTPMSMRAIDSPLTHLVQRNVELRVMPSLWELREAVVASSLAFSITRMRNAAPPPPGFVTKYPVS